MSSEAPAKDPLSGVETTGHVWDGIQELNNPAPRWWLIIFIVTVIWSIGYWVVYPTLIVKRGETSGMFGWSSLRQLHESQAEIQARRDAKVKNFDALSLEEIHNAPDLYEFAKAGGQALFKENCAPCHGSGAAGGRGYPNLNDDDWIWGGTLQDVYVTLQHGIRAQDEETRSSMMPAFGKDGILNKAQIQQVAAYVLSLSGQKTSLAADTQAAAATLYAENCASCHGEKGEGMRDMGAPRLNDAIWLYGGSHDEVVAQISRPKSGVMPNWASRLPDASIKQLAIYVDSLGGTQKNAPAPEAAPPADQAAPAADQAAPAAEQAPAAPEQVKQ